MASKAHPSRLERLPSSRQGMYLTNWKGFLPAGEVQWVDSEKWLLILDSRAPKHKF
jgi:hypothetical protein